MISKSTLEAVRIGILTDNELAEALTHYRELEQLLKPHGQLYHLVYIDVLTRLRQLEGYYEARTRNRKNPTPNPCVDIPLPDSLQLHLASLQKPITQKDIDELIDKGLDKYSPTFISSLTVYVDDWKDKDASSILNSFHESLDQLIQIYHPKGDLFIAICKQHLAQEIKKKLMRFNPHHQSNYSTSLVSDVLMIKLGSRYIQLWTTNVPKWPDDKLIILPNQFIQSNG